MADHALATVTNPSSALTDFTLVVDLSTMPANWWTAVDTSDGTRGRVYKGDGSTELACDWIDFDDTAETGLLRVKWTGTLATTGTQQLWIEPPVTGNATVAASATYGSDNAYDASWEGYWPDGGATDRTANSLDLTGAGSVSAGDSTGKIGKATDYNGSSQYHYGTAPVTGVPITMMGWFNPDSSGTSEVIANLSDNSASNQQFSMYRKNSDNSIAALTFAGTVAEANSTTSLTSGNWGHAAAVYAATDTRVAYLNGGNSGSDGNTLIPTGIDRFGIGASQDSTTLYGDGQIGEVQLHSTDRSADWISHEYDQTNDNATFWGTWSWESTSSTDALTGSDLTGGTPTLDTPTIGQTHSLTGSEVTSGTPTLDTPTIGQTHGLTGTEITSGTPTLGTPTLAEGTDNLTSADLTGSAPVLDTPTLGQTHTLTGTGLTSSAPTLDTPTVGQVHGLTGTEITSGTPTLDSPTMTEVVGTDALTSADLLGGTPTLGTPTLGQVHALSGTDILGGVSIDSPALGQTHTLTATEITSAAPTLGTPTLSDFLYLFVENFTGTSTMTTTKTGTSAMTTEEAGTSVMTTEYAETSAFN